MRVRAQHFPQVYYLQKNRAFRFGMPISFALLGVALWSWNVDTNRFAMDERAFDLWGVPLSEFVTFDDLSSHIHPADRDRVKAAFTATRAIIGAYEIDFRIMVGEEARWISARSQGNDAGHRDRRGTRPSARPWQQHQSISAAA
jgi:hypothetical protein